MTTLGKIAAFLLLAGQIMLAAPAASEDVDLELVLAVDGSGSGKSKLSTPHYGKYIGWLSADELGMAFGRQTVIHAALASGGLAKRVVEEAQRLRGVRKTDDGGKGRTEG